MTEKLGVDAISQMFFLRTALKGCGQILDSGAGFYASKMTIVLFMYLCIYLFILHKVKYA